MPNTVQTNKVAPGIIAKMAAQFLDDHVQFVKTIDKADESDWDGKNGYNAGDTIQIAKPARFVMNTGANITSAIQDVVEQKVPLALTNQQNVAINFTSAEIATDLALKSWAQRVLKPQMITLANGIEAAAILQAKNSIFNSVGTPNATTFDTDTILAAGQKIDENACPDYSNRFVLLNPQANRFAVNARKGLFQKSDEIADQYREGAMGTADGFTFLRNNLLSSQTQGTHNVTGVTASADLTNGSGTVALAGLGNALTVNVGEIFTIATIFAVHPITKATLSSLQQFVVTVGGTSSAGGALSITVAPVIYGSAGGSLQNVSALTANGQAIAFVGTASQVLTQNMAYHKSAFRFVSVPLVKPDGVDMVGQETVNGITVRIIRFYDGLLDRMVMRADVLWGMANVRPEWGVRITQ